MMEVEELFEQQEEELNILAIKKQELNNNEEAVKFELSGLHGAKVVLQQLIEEAKDGQTQSWLSPSNFTLFLRS
jgi:hypothetical protein